MSIDYLIIEVLFIQLFQKLYQFYGIQCSTLCSLELAIELYPMKTQSLNITLRCTLTLSFHLIFIGGLSHPAFWTRTQHSPTSISVLYYYVRTYIFFQIIPSLEILLLKFCMEFLSLCLLQIFHLNFLI